MTYRVQLALAMPDASSAFPQLSNRKELFVGEAVSYKSDGSIVRPDSPAIPYFLWDGRGPDLWLAARAAFDAAAEKACGFARQKEGPAKVSCSAFGRSLVARM